MSLRDWFEKAQKEGWALGAFNIDTLETLRAVCEAAKVNKSPVIVEFSPGEVEYFGIKNVIDITANAKEEYDLPIFLNLDHGKSKEACFDAVELSNEERPRVEPEVAPRFDMVHFDGSQFETTENIKAAREIVESAHKKGILVEGEIDKVSGASQINPAELNLELLKQSYTDPKKAADFVKETGVDIFAAVFGNVHGVFDVQPDLDFELLAAIRTTLGDTFISMHGGSGIPKEDVTRAIEVGRIVKINVNTELRQAYKDALGEELSEKPDEYAFYNISPDVVMAIQAVVENKMDVFGSSGKS